MGENKLTFLVLSCLYIYLDLITHLQVRIVTELGDIDDTLALIADVHENLALSDGHHGSFNYLVLHYLGESLIVHFLVSLTVCLGSAFLKTVPVKLVHRHGCVAHTLGSNFLYCGSCLGILNLGSLHHYFLFFFHNC